MSTLFEARFSGRCDANGCEIEPGDEIGYADGYDRPLCKRCWNREQAEVALGNTERDLACPQCHLIHAGEC